ARPPPGRLPPPSVASGNRREEFFASLSPSIPLARRSCAFDRLFSTRPPVLELVTFSVRSRGSDTPERLPATSADEHANEVPLVFEGPVRVGNRRQRVCGRFPHLRERRVVSL